MQENKLKAALFDLDGVVFDTEPQYTIFWGSQCRLYHPEHPHLEQEIKGQTLDQIYGRWFSGELAKEQPLITKRLDCYEQNMRYEFIDGFEPFVKALRLHGVKTALVTSSNQKKMEVVYGKVDGFRTLFDHILTSEDFDRSKPNPDCYLKAAQRTDAQIDECVVFEDSINGLRSGRAAQMKVVGLTTTNPLSVVEPLSDLQIANFLNVDFETINGLLK